MDSDSLQQFKALYEKERPPALREKVEKIVLSTLDINARIRKIQEVDDWHGRRLSEEDLAELPARPSERRAVNGSRTSARPQRPGQHPRAGRPGILGRIFGGELAAWGRATGTLKTGLLGGRPELSPDVPRIFDRIAAADIPSVARTLQGCLKSAWRVWGPEKYNTLVVAHQLFTEFARSGSVFRRYQTPKEWVTHTTKLQVFYAYSLQYPNFEQTMARELPALLLQANWDPKETALVKKNMEILAKLDSGRPTLRNAFCAIYSLADRKLRTWESILKELRVGKPELRTYRAPESVRAEIDRYTTGLQQKLQAIRAQTAEVAQVREKRLEGEDTPPDFLAPILRDATRNRSEKSPLSGLQAEEIQTQAHKLLFAILKDMDETWFQILDRGVPLTSGHGTHEQHALYTRAAIKEPIQFHAALVRDMTGFLARYPELKYSFDLFERELENGTTDPVHAGLLKIVDGVRTLLKSLAKLFQTALYNHDQALELSRQDGAKADSLNKMRSQPLDRIDGGARFLPFSDLRVNTANRLNGLTIVDCVNQMSGTVFKYLRLLRDKELAGLLSDQAGLGQEVERIQKILARMNVPVEVSS